MKHPLALRPLRSIVGLALAATVFLLGGCLEKRIVWSPDGRQAAVLSNDGLRFCGADGVLADSPAPGICRVAWLADSQRLLVARERPAANWAEVAGVLGAERSRQIAAEAEAVWARIEQGALWSVVTLAIGDKNPLLRFRLQEAHGAELRARLDAGNWDELAKSEVRIWEVALARRQEGRIELGAPLFGGLETVSDLRIAPGEGAVAITLMTDSKAGDRFRLVVASLAGAAAPAVVATEVASFPDWTPDGRALVYFQSLGTPEKDLMRLGVLQQREVLAPDGTIAVAEKAVDLGGGVFQPFSRIRCLPDGRVVFNAPELTLPVAARDAEQEREELFALDPQRQATLVRLTTRTNGAKLPEVLGFFEPSPDGKTLLIGGTDGEVCVFTLATAEVEEVQGGEGGGQLCLPAWRGPGEFTYLRRAAAKDGRKPVRQFEVVLRSGDKETVLSRTWPDVLLEGLAK